MPEINEQWIREQMQEAKVKVGTGKALLALLAEWEKLTLSVPQQKEVIALFGPLAMGHSVLPEQKDEVWIDAQPGAILVADEVRVKADAYDGSTGAMHNGRRGKVVAVRYGDVIFKSTDGKEPLLDGAHYSPHQLQKRVR